MFKDFKFDETISMGLGIIIVLFLFFAIKRVRLRTNTRNELEEQAQALHISQQRLKLKQEELEIINNELKERTRRLEENARALKMANNYKSQFLANMSHELRTPLNSILVLSQLLANKEDHEPLTEKQKEFAKTIYSSGTDLLKLINNILDFSKLEAGKMVVNIEGEDIRLLISKIEKTFKQIADEKNVDLIVEVKEDVPAIIYTDIHRLQQIINNLISNALKFTEKGSVTLKVSRYKNEMMEISVKDTGIGIPADKHGMIFEAFSQSDGTISRRYGGTGLGLSISTELVRLLGGDIYLSSEVGIGSTFSIILPTCITNTDTTPNLTKVALCSETLESHEFQLKDKKILIIDHDMRNVFSLTSVLEDKGVKVIIGKNGIDGIQKLNGNMDIELVLMDIMMPEMDGYAVIKEIRNNISFKELPIIVLSAKDKKHISIEAGANEYLEKPIDSHKLLEVIAGWVNK